MISREKIDLLRKTGHENLVSVVSDFITLKKRGAQYIGKSPFSNERTPSFTVHPAKGIFKCFSSGKGGDCMKFLELTQNWKFNQAAQYLGKKYGIDIDGVDEYSYVPKTPEKFEEIKPDFIHPNTMLATIGEYDDNPLFKYLSKKIEPYTLKNAFKKYHIGCSGNWVIYWQVDYETFVRSGKFIKYKIDGHRDKDAPTTWEHSKTKEYKPVYPDFILQQCFFGEHLISENHRQPIAIVESEKTAVIASIFMPSYIWIACGSKNGLGQYKCEILKNRSVTLFPDLDAFDEWKIKAKELGFSVNTLMEKFKDKPGISKGFDIADLLLTN